MILFNLSGHGHFDLSAYEKYLSGGMENYEYETQTDAEIKTHLPQVIEAEHA